MFLVILFHLISPMPFVRFIDLLVYGIVFQGKWWKTLKTKLDKAMAEGQTNDLTGLFHFQLLLHFNF